ncbi:hypothetical protein [Sulfolobus acidocaldarius]|uniref:hypothetical protein n=1 Tax=Sulfolobus acidocaldarius TaxID=2285 RepID=UPI001E6387FA|nr:hypothetical protein [Sulfolobus acidocaldarius]
MSRVAGKTKNEVRAPFGRRGDKILNHSNFGDTLVLMMYGFDSCIFRYVRNKQNFHDKRVPEDDLLTYTFSSSYWNEREDCSYYLRCKVEFEYYIPELFETFVYMKGLML